MENYIRDLLKEKDRVIIPNLGGFLKSKGEINNLIFNEFIKFNDGQLINFIAKRENIGIDEASEKVDQFVESTKAKLNKGKKIKIEEVGTLFMGERGRMRFIVESAEDQTGPDVESPPAQEEPEEKKDVIAADSLEEEQSEEEKETPVREPSEEEKEAAEKELIEETQSSGDTGDGLAEKPPVPVPDEKDEKNASVEDVIKKKDQKTTQGEKIPKESRKEKIPQMDPRGIPPGDKNSEREQKRRSPLLWLIPLIILIALGIWIILDYDNIRGYFHMNSDEVAETEPAEMVDLEEPEKEETQAVLQDPGSQKTHQEENAMEKDAETTTPAEEIKPEANQVAAEEKVETENLTSKAVSPAKKYHLIAGVFSERENAAELVEELKKEGFYADIVAVVKGRYYVSYNSFKKKSDAKYEWQRLLDKGYEAWLYYY